MGSRVDGLEHTDDLFITAGDPALMLIEARQMRTHMRVVRVVDGALDYVFTGIDTLVATVGRSAIHATSQVGGLVTYPLEVQLLVRPVVEHIVHNGLYEDLRIGLEPDLSVDGYDPSRTRPLVAEGVEDAVSPDPKFREVDEGVA